MNTCILKWTPAVLLMSILAGCGLGVGVGGDGGGDGGAGGGGDGGSGGGGGGTPPPPKFTIGGTVTGLQGSMVLRNNGQDDLTVTADGLFALATSIETGRPYFVTIQTQPTAQVCVLANESGTVAGANVVGVTVTCSALQATQLHVDANVHSANLSWSIPHNATFNVYVSSAPHCDIQNFSACPDGAVHANVTSPLTIEELRNGQAYFFQVDATLSDGRHQLSNEASARPNALAFNNAIEAIAFGDDGTQYVGGHFTAVGIASGGAVPINAASSQPAMPDFPIVTGVVKGGVLATVSDGHGGWYIGGLFAQVGGQAHRNLAHIFADGTVDPHFTFDLGNDEIDALAFSGDTLYAAGEFNSIDGHPRNGLAAFDVNGTLLDWNPEANAAVLALAVAGNVVYAGGDFTSIGPVLRNRVAAIGGVDGKPLVTWDPNVADGSVVALEVSGNTVYVGGAFSSVGGMARPNLAAISTAGELLPWNPHADANAFVTALAVAGNTVYVGGDFHAFAGQTRNHLAAVDAGAGELLGWHPDANGVVSALKVAGGTVYAGGDFSSIDGIKRSNLAAIGSDGQVLAWNPAPNDEVFALAITDDTVFVGGLFTGIASATRNFLAAIDGHGGLTAWNPDADSAVLALAFAGNTVYAGGAFNQVASETRNHLAAIGTNGALLPWSPGTDNDVTVLTISGNTVYAGGRFTHVTTAAQGTQARGSLAAIDTNGALLNWNPSFNNTVNALLVSGGTVYVGGAFTEVTTAAVKKTRNHLAAIDTGGVLSDLWNPNANGQVSALAIIDNTLYAGGTFTMISNQARNHLAAVGTDGGVLGWQVNADVEVRALAVSGKTLYAGGLFRSVTDRNSMKPRRGLAAIDVNGDVLDWNPDLGDVADAGVLAISGETVYVGGDFATLGGLPRFFFGAVDAGGAGAVIP